MTSNKHTNLSSSQLMALILIAMLGITITSVLYLKLSKEEEETQLLNFELTSKEVIAAIEKEVTSDLEVLISINSLYAVNDSVSREQFKTFNSSTLNRTKSIQALSWIPKVSFKNKSLFESGAHNDGLSHFMITEKIAGGILPVVDRKEYYPVYYIEPLKGNEAALGFDLASNPARLSALEKSIKKDHLTATERITLVQEKGTQKAILVFYPHKKHDKIIGMFTGVYRIKDLILQSVNNLTTKNCNITIYDISAKAGNQLLAQLNESDILLLPDDAILTIPEGINYQQTIKVADREWSILCTPTQTYLNALSKSPELILIICIILSLSAFYYFFRIFKTINQQKLNEIILESKVRERTLELEKAVKNVSDYKTALDEASIVAITDTKGNIEYINNKFCEISKYSKKELIGKNQRIVNSNYHNIDFWKEMWATIGKGNVWRNEIRNKTKTGDFYWVDTTIVPFMDKNNKPYQYLSIRRDITQQKKIEQDIIKSIIFTQEQEREYVAEDLHEGLAQNLTGLNFHIKFIESKTKEIEDEDLSESISLIKTYIHQSIESSRSLAMDLMPRSMMKEGIIPSIKNYINDKCIGIDIEFEHNFNENNTKKEIEITIYRSVVSILEKVISSPSLKKVVLTLNDNPIVQIELELHGKHALLAKENSDILLNIQKRTELHGGQLIMLEEDNNQTSILIKFESQ